MRRTKKEETLEAMEATGKNPEKSFLELTRTSSASSKVKKNRNIFPKNRPLCSSGYRQ